MTRFITFFAIAFAAIFLVSQASAQVFPSSQQCGNGSGANTGNPFNCPKGGGVPGPIAGVGLPFLIGGVVAYRRRRKAKSEN